VLFFAVQVANGQNITTYAGGPPPNNLPALSASLGEPEGVAADKSGNFYFVSQGLSSVFKVDATGTLSLVAGNGIFGFSGDGGLATAASLNFPHTVAVDGSGNLFIADGGNGRIRRVDVATGIITTVAGGGCCSLGDGGPATSALVSPWGVAVDSSSNLFIAEGSRIRRVDHATGIITTVAGNGTFGFSGDGGPATSAQINFPRGIAVDGFDNLLIADTNNNHVRRVDAASGVIATVAGNGTASFGGDGGLATSASLNSPWAVASDTSGNILIADYGNSRLRIVAVNTGIITTVAGGGCCSLGDGGLATNASLSGVVGIAIDSVGNRLITDTFHNRIRQVDAATQIITTVAGGGPAGGDNGPSVAASLAVPAGVAVNSSGDLFLTETYNNRVRRIDHITGAITTVAGTGMIGGYGGPALQSSLDNPTGIAVDSQENLFIVDTFGSVILRVDAVTGILTVVAGGGCCSLGDGGPATSAQLGQPRGTPVVDKAGNLIFSDGFNQRIRRVDAVTGVITTIAGNGTQGFSGDGAPAINAQLNYPDALALDSSGNLFIADNFNSRVRRVDAVTGIITTIAGNGTFGFSGDGGAATAASLNGPDGLAFDGGGNLFILDSGYARIRRVDAASGVITTVAGNGARGYIGDGGPALSATLNPFGIADGLALNGSGDLFFADALNNRIRRIAGIGPADTLALVSGNNQTGVAGQTLANPLVVKVTNASGNPVSGTPITFAVTAGGGTLTGGVAQLVVNTDAEGLASVTLNLDSTPGPNNVTATAVGLSGSPVSFTEAGQPQPGISITPIPVAFGNVPILTSSNQTVTITSTGQGPLTINSISIAGSYFSLGSLPSFPVVLAPSGTVSFGVTFAPLATGPANATITITSNAQTPPTLVTVTGNGVPVTTSCVAAPTGLVSWWTGDGNIYDLLGASNPSASNAVSFVSGEVASAFTLGAGGYIEIPASASLANQQFTWSAWVRPDGPGPNNDFDGNWIVGQDIDNTNLSVYLSWRATDNRFSLTFGNQLSEQIVSQDAFAPGQFYFVAGSYDGSTFTLYVNGQIEATRSSVKTISYSSLTWTIGASSANIRAQGYPRTWNGVIDEVQAFSRALSQSEVQAIFNAGSLGECKPLGVAVAPSPVAFGNVAILTSSKITATITNAGQGSLAVNSITIAGANFKLGNLPTLPIVLAPSGTASFDVIFNPLSIVSSNATITITSNAATSPTVIQATGSGIAPPLPPATSITVGTDQAVYHRGQAVQISGTLAAAGGAGIPNIVVNLQVSLNGTNRTLTATTDASGTYHAVFQPAPNDGGAFTVTAVGTSGGATQTATANFRILGLLLSPTTISQDLLMGSGITVPFSLQNLGDAALNGLSYSVTVTPAGTVSVTPPQNQSSIASGASLTLPVTVTAPAGNPPPGTVSVVLNVSGTDPTSGLTETNSGMIVITLRSAVSLPVLLPSTASVGVNPGGSLTSTFTVRNDGFTTINPTVTLQSPASVNWVALGGGNLGTIVPTDSRQFTIEISPPSSVAVGSYAVPFTVSGGSAPLQGTLNISVTQSTMGSVSFVVNNDIGANVAGAMVTLYGKSNGKTFQGVTDNTGLLTINGVDAGDYFFVVVAGTHDPTNGVVTVTAGSTAQVNVILGYDVVALSFLVTPTTIVDQYNVTLNVTYATTLPKPALQVVPYSLDFSFFPEDTTNGRYACSLSIANTHPTAPVRNLFVDATQLDVSQPIGQRLRVFFSNNLQTYPVGDLAGKATVNVPCYAVIDGGTIPTHSVGNIVVQANYDFSLSGQVLQGTTTTNVPVTYTRPSDLTFSPIAFTYDMKTDPANPVLIYNGNGYVYDIKSNRVPGFALQKPAGAPFNGHNLVAFTETQGGTTILDVINGNQGNAFWHGDFDSLKQSLTGLGDSTTYDISTLDCPTSPNCAQGGLTLPQALASQVAMSPNQVLFDPTYLAFEGQWADATSPVQYLIPVRITKITPTSISTPRGPTAIGGSCDPTDPLYALCKDNFGGGGGGFLPAQGGQILIAIDQTIRLERQAFNAALGIGAKTTLSNVVASIQILDANGADASSNFFVLVTSDPLGATHGGTVAGQTVVSWQLIPNAGAGGTLPQGAQYRVKANLTYTAGGVARVASTQTVTITVMPSPKLTVAYTAPFVVVPGKDAKIRVTLKNIGYGTAHNLTIQSAQPRVAATLPANPLLDNPGPLVNFTISGSSNTADGSGFQAGNLTVSFGDVAPGATVSGYWTLQVSQRGFFIDINSTFSHTDFNGIALDPLILPPTTTLVPAIGGTVTTDLSQAIPGLTVNVSQAGSAVGSDQTDASGAYYIQDLAAGSYLEEVRDLSGTVLTSKTITVLGNQATDFIDFVIANYNPTLALVCVNSSSPGISFSADGVSYNTPHCFPWTIGSSHTLGASNTGSVLSASVIRPLATSAPLGSATPPPAQAFVGWSDAETAATRSVTVTTFGATYTPLYRPTAEVNQYTRTQITTDPFDHKWPSTNTLGDLVWSEKDSAGFWQVVEQGPSTGNMKRPITTDQHNHERPAISDNGTIAWFQDSTGGGLGYAIERLDPGANTPSIVEFSSRNVFCPTAQFPTSFFFGFPIFSTTINTGPCSYKEHAGGKTFGIGSDGRTISFYTFTDTNNPPPFRRFNVTGIGQLPLDSAPDDFYGYESPDINSQSDIVYANSFVPGVVSKTRYIWLATTTQPFTQTLIDQGENPHLSDRPAAGTNPEIVYIQSGIDVTHRPGADPSKWVALGLWADIAGTGPTGTIVYECVVNGLSQICTAKPTPVYLAIASPDPQTGIVGATLPNPLAVKTTNQQGNAVSGVGISFAISQQPAGAGGTVINPTTGTTGQDGTATTQLTLGDTVGPYQVTASCSNQSCVPATVTFTANALSGISVTTNVPASTFTITGPMTFSGGGTYFTQINVPAGTYTIAYGAVDGYKSPPSETKSLLANGGISFVGTYVPSIAVNLVDPVPGLLNGSSITTDVNQLASSGRIVAGVAADGVTEVLVQIQANNVGDQFALTVFNDQNQQSISADEDGALGNPGDVTFSLSQITASAVLTPQGAMAFAVYRAPIDFPRATGQDAGATMRSVSIQVQLPSTGATVSVPVTILRVPVVLVHGIWSDPFDTWGSFSPLFSYSQTLQGVADKRFSVGVVNYSSPIGTSIQSSVPTFSRSRLDSARGNALGFDYNANKILGQIQSQVLTFKNGLNPLGIEAAAVQADIVAHSMGGNITRYLALQPAFLSDATFSQGNVHKVITIDTPHLGTPLADDDNTVGQRGFGLLQNANSCVRWLLAFKGEIAFSNVTINGVTVNGAVGDLQGDGFGGSLSPALQKLQVAPHLLPTALVAGVSNSNNLNPLSDLLSPATAIYQFCGLIPRDPLAIELTPQGWPTVFNQPSDAIVPLQSQLNNLSPSQGFQFFGYIHSNGTAKLGFGLPAVTSDPTQLVPSLIINLLNTNVKDSAFVRLP